MAFAPLPEFGPPLPELVARRTGWHPRAVVRVLLAVLLAALAALLLLRALLLPDFDNLVHRGDPTYNFSYDGDLLTRVAARTGEDIRLEHRDRGGRLVESFAVSPLALPGYSGSAGGELPLIAERWQDLAARRYPGFELVEATRARVVDAPGFAIVFRQRRAGRPPRFGRLILLPEPGGDRGIVIELIATRAAGAESAADAGNTGAIKRPYRSLRFGTERP